MALIPPMYIDCVVAIGTVVNETTKWIGTGFLYGNLEEKTPNSISNYSVYLVTNRHVLNNLDSIIIRSNSAVEQSSRDYLIPLKDSSKKILWTGHSDPEIDVAVIQVNFDELTNQRMKCGFFQSDKNTADINELKLRETSEGDQLFVLGFPMGIVSVDRQHVFVRGGVISRIKDLFEAKSKDYIIDAFIFPGSSGSPVISRPETMSIMGTKFSHHSSLIGIVKSYITYTEIAISQQTGKQRIIFEENTGLTRVEPVDHIIQTIEIVKKNVVTP